MQNNNNNNNNDFGYSDDPAFDLGQDFKKINANIEGRSVVEQKSISDAYAIKTSNKQIRLANKDIDILTKHFEGKGLKFATGVRMVLVQYINDNSLTF